LLGTALTVICCRNQEGEVIFNVFKGFKYNLKFALAFQFLLEWFRGHELSIFVAEVASTWAISMFGANSRPGLLKLGLDSL